VVWRILLVIAWVVAAVVLRRRGERFWRSVVLGLLLAFGALFGIRFLFLALAAFADSLG